MKKLLIIFILFICWSVSKAQYVTEFSQDTTLFLDELTTLFGNSLMDDEEPYLEGFAETWTFIEEHHREEIMMIAELMRQRSCRPRPQYIMYIKILEEFFREKKALDQFDDWLQGYKSFMEDENTLLKQINGVNNTVFDLLHENLIYRSVGVVWRLGEPNFNFSYDEKLLINIANTSISGISGDDSIVINNVNGYVDPVNQHFYGEQGIVFWERAGLPPEIIYAVLNEFDFQLKRTEYHADSVKFYNYNLFDEPALGRLQDRITQIRKPELAQYPKFNTYQSSFQLRDIVPGINYRGAIAMRGAKLAGTSAEDRLAQLNIFFEDTLRMKVQSDAFIFSTNSILSQNAEVSIYIADDSIYHPELIFNFSIDGHILRLMQSRNYNSQGPYTDSYHRVDMNFDELNWNIEEPLIRMQAALGTALGNSLFESFDFFNYQYYESLQGMDFQNPLMQLRYYSNLLGTETFSAENYADHIRYEAYMVKQQLMQLSKMGFIYFDLESDLVTLRPKLYDYIDASQMKRDYDIIRFVSRTETGSENAMLDLRNYDLTIRGIPAIFLSDSQNVRLVPTENTITMKRNRNFQFDGVINAGLFTFHGKNFFFDYDNFLLNLQKIDSLSISTATGRRTSYGDPVTAVLENRIVDLTGELLIDAPFNKSGASDFPEYPIFTSRENSYIYFDEKSIQDGVYERDRFYFELFPFTIDSLDNFRREAMKLDGTFVSAGILPDIEMEMSLRPDNSLGFLMTTEPEGISIFGGKGTFYNGIEMSNAGLRGFGSFDYLASTTWSDNFLFHPDSLMAVSRRFLSREKQREVSTPYVEASIADVRYYPYDDKMNINRIDSLFRMYDDEIKFGGNLTLRPLGITGAGGLSFDDARFSSQVFDFRAKEILADSSGARLRKDIISAFSFVTNDIKLDIDLIKREGDFTARENYTLIEFPSNLYETRLDEIKWDMERDEVVLRQRNPLPEMAIDIGIDSLKTTGPSYISVHPKQDSLHFTAPVAFFNYTSNVLNAEKVAFLEIGDAYIIPDNGYVEVTEKAEITPLKQAKILMDTDVRYHFMYDANLVVDSRIHYRGGASYDYYDELENRYTIRFSHVEVDTSVHSFGEGEILPEDNFRLSPYFDYQGQVSMHAMDSLLTFAGGVKLNHGCELWSEQWLKFEAAINPDSVIIPLESRMQNLDLNNIYAGTLKARDSIHIYPTFISGRKAYFDRNLTYSGGYLYYDKVERLYEIADSSKLSDMSEKGNYLALYTDSCLLYSEGKLDLQLDYGRVSLTTVGEASHDIFNNSLDMKTILGMDFHFSSRALEIFGNEIDSLPDLDPTDLTSDFYTLGIRNITGDRGQSAILENEIGLYGNYLKIPDSLKFTIMFNEVDLKWNQETRSYRCNGEVGIGLIGDIQVNKKVNAYMEFVERGSGDVFDIYLMVDQSTWYYFAYSPGGLQVLSSNRDFNSVIFDEPDRDRKLKARGRQSSYIYSLASQRRLNLFRERFLMNAKGQD
ncbi:MAG: hypothetical protein K9J30_06770 [Bacteroidales bacterium]|nr:hypothetical protein [Bacteroidales bacterium]